MIAVQAWNLMNLRKADLQKTEEYEQCIKEILDREIHIDDCIGNP